MERKEKIKVLLVASEYAPGMIPFATTIINTLSQDKRFDVHCVCVNSIKNTYSNLIIEKGHPVYVEYPKHKFCKLLYKIWPVKIIQAIEQKSKDFQPDIVHFLTGDFTLASYIKLRKNTNLYYTVHDLHPHEVKLNNLLEKIIFKDVVWGYRKCRESIDNLTTSSLIQLEELKSIYKNKNCVYTPFPTLVTTAIQKGDTLPIELNNVSDYILFFGSVNSYKGVDLLIEAFENSKISETTKLVIAGKGLDYKIHSKNIIRLNRYIDDGEIAVLFRKAKFVVYPYISATMSGVLSLAYYFNKLVLASDIPFFKENATPNITFFKNGDIGDLQLKLEDMVLNTETFQIDMTSYDRLYSVKALADSYWNLYNS